MNYNLQEYANDVVGGVMEVCDPENVPHPVLVTESGRATVAHHAVLVVDVLGVRQRAFGSIPQKLPPKAPPQVEYLFEAFGEIGPENLLESYHDVLAYRDDCLSLFNHGHLSLELRGLAEDLFWAACHKILELAHEQEDLAHELEGLETALADIYYCNFSVFQSIPDSWAIDQLFPVLPLHRLGEQPTARAVIGDITCDSDGKIDRFIGDRASKRVLELHPPDGKPYLLGVFLVGAYQDILGDLHNLFGDTNTVDISLNAGGGYDLDAVIAGNTVTDVLEVVRYEPEDLMARLRHAVEEAVRAGRLTLVESRQLLSTYQEGLRGYTYLEND
jgi:arginine decarboxylase